MKFHQTKQQGGARNSRQQGRVNEQGFTLLETAIALVLMTIVGLGAAALFAYAANNNTGARDRELSMAVAQQQMERLRSATFATLDTTVTNTGGTDKTVQSAGRSYRVVTTTSNSTTLKTVTVQVTPLGAGPAWSRINTVAGGVTLMTQRATDTLGANR